MARLMARLAVGIVACVGVYCSPADPVAAPRTVRDAPTVVTVTPTPDPAGKLDQTLRHYLSSIPPSEVVPVPVSIDVLYAGSPSYGGTEAAAQVVIDAIHGWGFEAELSRDLQPQRSVVFATLTRQAMSELVARPDIAGVSPLFTLPPPERQLAPSMKYDSLLRDALRTARPDQRLPVIVYLSSARGPLPQAALAMSRQLLAELRGRGYEAARLAYPTGVFDPVFAALPPPIIEELAARPYVTSFGLGVGTAVPAASAAPRRPVRAGHLHV